MKGLINKGPRRWGERREPAIRRPDCHGIIVTAARLNFAMHGRDEQLDLGSMSNPIVRSPGVQKNCRINACSSKLIRSAAFCTTLLRISNARLDFNVMISFASRHALCCVLPMNN